MRRRSLRKNADAQIDLTPLLDVTFILLFFFLLLSVSLSAEAGRKREAAEQALREELAESRQQLAETRLSLSGLSEFASYARIVSVGVVNGEDKGFREYVLTEGEEAPVRIRATPSSERYAADALRETLAEIADASSGERPVFFSFVYAPEEIYRRDKDIIADALEEIRRRHEHVYIK